MGPIFVFRAPPTALAPNTRYDKMMEAFGGRGHLVNTPEELHQTFKAALNDCTIPVLINVLIDPMATRKAQVRNISSGI